MLNLAGDDIQKDNEEYAKKEALQTRIQYLEDELRSEQAMVDLLMLRLDQVKPNFYKACMLLLASVLVLFWVLFRELGLSAPEYFLINLIQKSYVVIIMIGGAAAFLCYAVRYAQKHIPMYIHCENEKKGKSRNDTNYVYQIEKHEKKIQDLENQLETAELELSTCLE